MLATSHTRFSKEKESDPSRFSFGKNSRPRGSSFIQTSTERRRIDFSNNQANSTRKSRSKSFIPQSFQDICPSAKSSYTSRLKAKLENLKCEPIPRRNAQKESNFSLKLMETMSSFRTAIDNVNPRVDMIKKKLTGGECYTARLNRMEEKLDQLLMLFQNDCEKKDSEKEEIISRISTAIHRNSGFNSSPHNQPEQYFPNDLSYCKENVAQRLLSDVKVELFDLKSKKRYPQILKKASDFATISSTEDKNIFLLEPSKLISAKSKPEMGELYCEPLSSLNTDNNQQEKSSAIKIVEKVLHTDDHCKPITQSFNKKKSRSVSKGNSKGTNSKKISVYEQVLSRKPR